MNERQLTFDAKGHFLNTTQCFSPDQNWIVYDTRNDDSKIGSTAQIEMVNVNNGEVKSLYQTQNQTELGPGVGAASFSPTANRVIFIHGVRSKTYGFTRRTGVAIDIDRPNVPIFMDARDIAAPFTPGALRGGTHAHSWSGDGQWLSFTYNDYVIEQLQYKNKEIKDLRTVGIMFPAKVEVTSADALENNNGEMFSVIVSKVTQNPTQGSDEIEKAFDECWIGIDGYTKPDGTQQKRAIAFQGNVLTSTGVKTEIFVVDLPETFDQHVLAQELRDPGDDRIKVPQQLAQRRITQLKNGVHSTRHWLRSSPDGSMIVFLSKDDEGYVNIFSVSPNGGEAKQLSFCKFDVSAGPSFSPDGKQLAYIGDGHVHILTIDTGVSILLTKPGKPENKPVGCVTWSADGKTLAFNRYEKFYLQIFLIRLLQ